MLSARIKPLARQFFNLRGIVQCLTLVVIPATLFYILAIKWLLASGFTTIEILRDPAQTREASSFLGFLSNIGVWLWVSAAAIGLFCTLQLSRGTEGRVLVFLVSLLSLLLGVDDFFMIHDRYLNQDLCYLAYACILLSILFFQWKTLVRTDVFPFLMAGIFLAMSIGTDLLQEVLPLGYTYNQVMEEGFKFLGASTWLYFTGRLSAQLLRP